MERFSCMTQVVWGCKAGDALKSLPFRRMLMVCDPFFYESGTAQRIAGEAKAAQIQYFHKVAPDPSVELAAEGVRVVSEFQPDAIVALGGGSAMDLAKAMRYFSQSEGKLIAIPTTSGSGSEVTDFAILTHEGVKHPLVDEKLRPDMAIVDPELVAKLPPGLVADGGFDVLTHALEALMATGANPITDALALDAFQKAFLHLPDSFAGKQPARSAVHMAATMAGMAFTQAGLGICHALAHSLGGEFHVPHGRLNAILLPAVVKCNGCHKLAAAAEAVGLESRGTAVGLRNLHGALVRLRRKLGLPGTLAEVGAKPTEAIVSAALADPCCATNPVPVTRELLWQVLREVAGHG